MRDGIWRLQFLASSQISPVIAKDIAALNKMDSQVGKSGGLLARLFGKAAGAGGLGDLPASMGMGGIAAVGGAIAIGSGIRSLASAAMEADVAAQNAAASIREQYKMSDAAAQSMNELSLAGTTASSGLKKLLGEFISTLGFAAKYLGAAGLNAGAAIGRAMGIDMSPTEARIESTLVSMFASMPEWMGGVGGTGEGGAAAAEVRLQKARKRRADADKRRVRGGGDGGGNGYTVPIDELARMGMFVGGAKGENLELLRESNRKLDTLIQRIEALPQGLAEQI